ncbi:FAD-dependent oxidoreductase [Francisella sp. SYW-2]|uniref:FAD-dependent oxidoreductase n=1 Tax=Francisella sp. SYW-2 TaxID=2610886 RepID=UPI00123DE1C1|nr:FAD-dependent oxidoreductase [Francisella sp. SYW-2]
MKYDKIIIGAGIFGLYAATKSIEKGERVLVLEYDDRPFQRASYINQARVHNGYHYPRSYSTALKSADYFDRFVNDYGFAILQDFSKIYAISSNFSYTNSKQFSNFCDVANIPCEKIDSNKFFKPNACDGVFKTLEYTFDANMICEYMLSKLKESNNFTIEFGSRINNITKNNNIWAINSNGVEKQTPFVINCTYASLNQILDKAGLELFDMKYELCEIALCKVSDNIKDVGLTVMDGPFFSLMPFGKTGYHSLTSVGNTPHLSSNSKMPTYDCQKYNDNCSDIQLDNCNICRQKPASAFDHMNQLAKSYLNDDIKISYHKSLFSVKAILATSEVDDSRPTIIRLSNDSPKFLSVFSGKINTIYDLDEVL